MIGHIAFIDIETVAAESVHTKLFLKRFANKMTAEDAEDINQYYRTNAGLYAEHGKIISIAIGKQVTDKESPKGKFYIRTIIGQDEPTILKQAVDSITKTGATHLCAHNGLEFDFPFLMRRLLIHGLALPEVLNNFNKKPWDMKLEDTMKMWSGSAWNYKISLELLAYCLHVESPKKGISGEDIQGLYDSLSIASKDELPFDKEARVFKQIGEYNAGDVLCSANCYCRMRGLPLIENVEYV